MWITKLASDRFANSLVTNNLIPVEYKEAYSYCINYVLDLFCFNGSLIILGTFTHNLINSIVYLFALVPLKMMAGGAHANSQIKCSFISYSVFISIMYLSNFCPGSPIVLYTITIISLIGISALAPVEHPNQNLSYSQRKRLKRLSIIYCIGLYIVQLFMVKLNLKYGTTVSLCVLVILINQLIGKIIYRKA